MTKHRTFTIAKLAPLVGAVLLSGSAGYWFASRSSTAGGEGASAELAAPVELPKRLRAEQHASVELPALPAELKQAPRLTAELEVRSNVQIVQRKLVTRTAERVHVQLGVHPGAPEWLFVRNPVDPRRVSGSLVDHAQRAILEHDDTALRSARIARGWADVVSLGVPLQSLQPLAKGARERTFAGVRFAERSAADDPATAELRELWWSNEAVVPLIMRASSGGLETTTTLSALRLEVDESRLIDPRERFPDYEVVEAIDWLEQHHDHGDHEPAASARALERGSHSDHAH